jgi:glucose/arabinose dehydrogenase/PKD repeat protein
LLLLFVTWFVLGQVHVPELWAANLPTGFVEETVGFGWNEVVGVTFAADGRMYAWERGGKVWIVENGVKSATPFLDLSEEVGGWRDFGLLGFCLHPQFYTNGYLYLLYMVDHHHLKNFGTPNYDPNTDEYFTATISRLTRYTARSSDGFRSVDPASRKILLGESITTGIPSTHQSHGPGSVLFGTDGTLLVSCGDGASYSSADVGSAGETYWQVALDEGIIRPKENVGSLRAQMVDSLSGKILRLDPATGDGVPSNPFYDSTAPRSARSRVWALGLRNPCRVNLRPGTGSTNPAEANPGVLYIGDVGWRTWEDLNVCTGPGQNFGWPIFEGLEVQSAYVNPNIVNQDAPNPLLGVNGCTRQFFYFKELIVQETLGTPSWPNPCDSTRQIPASIPHFVHRRPALDWKHDTGPARAGIFSGTNAAVINVGASGSPVSGSTFPGNCSIGGVWYTRADFPPEYRNIYYHADYGEQWIKMFTFDANHRLSRVQDFATSAGGLVFVTSDPVGGGLYYIPWTSDIMRVRYAAANNQAPTARVQLERTYGTSPLTVQFSGSSSTDPENQPLTYLWDFGDGSLPSAGTTISHTFVAPAGVPTPFTVTLVVTDPGGLRATNRVVVSVNNTPPQVVITSPVDGAKYPMSGDTVYNCTAMISDAEHSLGQLTCSWQTILHHAQHEHEDPPVNDCATTTVISPVGCDGETYYYRVVLIVSDPAGLSTTNEVRLYPDCPPPPPVVTLTSPTNGAVFVGPKPVIPVVATVQSNDWSIFRVLFFRDGAQFAETSEPPYALTWSQVPDGVYTLTARALFGVGGRTTSAPVTVLVQSPPAAPVSLVAAALGSREVSVLWTPGSTNQTGFLLERSTNGTAFSFLASVAAADRKYVDRAVSPATTYFYRLRATNAQGGSAFSIVARAATPLFSGAHINFQPAAAAVPPGYDMDAGDVYGTRSSGLVYGWNVDNTANMVDRNASTSPDQRYDTYAATQVSGGGSIWEIAVPNGAYQVVLVAGDPNRQNNTSYRYNLEGTLSLSGNASSSTRWFTSSNLLTVADGKLTLSNGTGANNNRVCFIDISAPLAAPFSVGWLRRDATGRVTLRLEGIGGRAYRIDVSEDLRSWQTLSSVLNQDGTVSFDDPLSLTRPQRFYRATFTP